MPAHSHLGDLAVAPGAPGLPVSTLPANPGDGQTVAFQNAAMAEAGVLWLLRYRAASASAYKWEFVGGAALHSWAEGPNSKAVTGGTWESLASSPSLTAPLAGDYEIEHCATILPAGEIICILFAGVSEGGAAPAATTIARAVTAKINRFAVYLSLVTQLAGVGAGKVLDQRYQSSETQTIEVETRHLRMRPVRLG